MSNVVNLPRNSKIGNLYLVHEKPSRQIDFDVFCTKMVTIALNNLNSLLYDMPYRILSVGRSFNHSIESACTVYTVFYKKDPFFHNSLMTQMMIDLHEIFNSCS